MKSSQNDFLTKNLPMPPNYFSIFYETFIFTMASSTPPAIAKALSEHIV